MTNKIFGMPVAKCVYCDWFLCSHWLRCSLFFLVVPVLRGYHPFSGNTKWAGSPCSAIPRPAAKDLSMNLMERRHVCSYCEKSFQFRNDYLGHLNSKHFNRRPYVCKFCSKSFPYSQSLRRHMLMLHETRNTLTSKKSAESMVPLVENVPSLVGKDGLHWVFFFLTGFCFVLHAPCTAEQEVYALLFHTSNYRLCTLASYV